MPVEKNSTMVRVEKIREAYAERVTRSLREGIVPWQRKELPPAPLRSASSGGKYAGANAFYLMETCVERGYVDNRFITASAANELGLYVRKGEHGVPMEHWPQRENEKMGVYTVFNVSQLGGDRSKLPVAAGTATGETKRAEEMLKNAGVAVPPGSGVQDCQDAIRRMVKNTAEEAGYTRSVHTPELMALRNNIASTIVMREAGLPVEQIEGLPTKSWSTSIRHDSSQLYKAIRDGGNIARSIVAKMTQGREESLFRATEERRKAGRAQEVVAEAVSIPRGSDSYQPAANPSSAQETVLAATEKAVTQVTELLALALRHEAGAGPNVIAEAKRLLGNGSIVTHAQPGMTYSGKIAGVLDTTPDKTAIQQLMDNHAVLHTLRNTAALSTLKPGDDVTIVVGEDGRSVIQGREADHARKNELAREGMKR